MDSIEQFEVISGMLLNYFCFFIKDWLVSIV